MDLESAARELKILASKESLAPSELDRAKDLMVELKRLGMSNPEIVELTGGRWSESTLKGYTKGTTATDPEPWKSTTALFSEMLSMNLTLAQVRQAMATTTELEAMGSSLGDVVSLMEGIKRKETNVGQLREAININAQLEQMGTSPGEIAGFVSELQRGNINAPAFVLLLHDWREAGLTPVDAQSALNYKEQLEGTGFDIEALPQIAEAARKFGNPPEMLEAVTKYGNLGQLDQELQTKWEELDEEVRTKREELDKEVKTRQEKLKTLATEVESRRQELDAASQKLEEVQNKTAAAEKALATYERLEAIGFDEKTLGELAKAAEKYGTTRKVLRAVNGFADLSNIKATDDELRTKVKQKRQMVKSLEEEHSHLKEPIEMCKRLLKHKFGLRALSLINATAWRYGEPPEVMKAIEAYGQLKEINKEINQAETQLAEMEAKVQVLNKIYAEQNARNIAMLDQFEVLNAKAIEAGCIVGSVQEQIGKDTLARDVLNLLRNPMTAGYEDYATLVLPLAKSMRIWVNENKSRFTLPYRIDEGLEALAKNLGGS